jgi:hypothetical protein
MTIPARILVLLAFSLLAGCASTVPTLPSTTQNFIATGSIRVEKVPFPNEHRRPVPMTSDSSGFDEVEETDNTSFRGEFQVLLTPKLLDSGFAIGGGVAIASAYLFASARPKPWLVASSWVGMSPGVNGAKVPWGLECMTGTTSYSYGVGVARLNAIDFKEYPGGLVWAPPTYMWQAMWVSYLRITFGKSYMKMDVKMGRSFVSARSPLYFNLGMNFGAGDTPRYRSKS